MNIDDIDLKHQIDDYLANITGVYPDRTRVRKEPPKPYNTNSNAKRAYKRA